MGKRALPSGAGSWLFPPHPACHGQTPAPDTLPGRRRELAPCAAQGQWGAGVLGLAVPSRVFSLTPNCPARLSLLLPTPSRFPENIVPITSENSRARTKGPTSFFLPVPFASKP